MAPVSGLIVCAVGTTAIFFWLLAVAPDRVGRGRLTRALRVLPPRRFFSIPWVRFSRFIVLSLVAGPVENVVGGIWERYDLVYWGGCIVYFLDDYLTGDDDRWRRFKDAVRNKIRWLMELPKPAEPTTA